MGPRFNKLQKTRPDMIPHLFHDIRLLQMVGAKYTNLEPGYTERYDHGKIPIETLRELATKVSLNDLNLSPPTPIQDVTDPPIQDITDPPIQDVTDE